MSEIKNYTMNFSSGRSLRGLNVLRTLAFTEVHGFQPAGGASSCIKSVVRV
jgi:hypothetical protein